MIQKLHPKTGASAALLQALILVSILVACQLSGNTELMVLYFTNSNNNDFDSKHVLKHNWGDSQKTRNWWTHWGFRNLRHFVVQLINLTNSRILLAFFTRIRMWYSIKIGKKVNHEYEPVHEQYSCPLKCSCNVDLTSPYSQWLENKIVSELFWLLFWSMQGHLKIIKNDPNYSY